MPTPPATAPETTGRADLLLSDLLGDTEVTASRDPGTEIRQAKQLSLQEKLAMHDLLREWVAMRPSDNSLHGNAISANLKKTFFDSIFDRWSTIEDYILLPTLPEKKFREMSIQVGKLTENLPVTPQKRKRGASEQRDAHRMCGAPAFLSVHLNIGSYAVGFLWRDGNSAAINQKFVEFSPGLTMKLAIKRAIINWDRCESKRIERFNTDLIVALARNRIIDFARVGTSHSPHIASGNQVNGRILKLQLASDSILAIAHDLTEIADECVAQRVGAPADRM